MSDFLGKGTKYPFQINVIGATGTSLAVSEQFVHIQESMVQILGTSPGERVMLPGFGSRLKELLFEPNDNILISLGKVYVADAIRRWEKRVIVREVKIDQEFDAGLFNIRIGYTIIKNQVDGNLVYPFYRENP